MINGDPKEFIEGLHYGDERFFLYGGCKYFIQGYCSEGKYMLEMYCTEPDDVDFYWSVFSDNDNYPVAEFENAPIFNGKTFWEAEKDIEWVDC